MTTTYRQRLPLSGAEDIVIKTKITRYTEASFRTVVFDAKTHLGPSSWLHSALLQKARESELRPLNHPDCNGLRDVLRLLTALPEWHVVTKQQAYEVRADAIKSVYRKFEQLHYAGELTRAAANKYSIARTFIREYLVNVAKNINCSTLKNYSPDHVTKNESRGTISDMLDEHSDIPEPIAALTHSTIADLKDKSIKKRDATLTRLKDACQIDIQKYKENCKWLSEIRNIELPRIEILQMRLQLPKAKNSRYKSFEEYPPDTYLSLQLQAADIAIKELPGESRQLKFLYTSELKCQFGHKFPFSQPWLLSLALYEQIGDSTTFHASLLLIQLATGWNISSVLSLQSNDIAEHESGLIIQSLKSKVDGDTPPVLIRHSDEATIFAIRFIQKRSKYLNLIGIKTNGYLFKGSIRSGSKVPDILGLKKKFQSRHDLPPYSWEQVRNEILAYNKAAKGLETSRRVAGHAGFENIHTYTEDIGERELSSAINLEFQRRLEKGIRKALESDQIDGESPNLTSIGDGSKCIDPEFPPDSTWLDGERCNAKHCHEDCRNRKIVIDEEMFAEVAFTKIYFQSAAERLIVQNQEAFLERHWPHMLFSITLERILSDGPYAHKMKSAMTRALEISEGAGK